MQAILVAPWPVTECCRTSTKLFELLEPNKRAVAQSIHQSLMTPHHSEESLLATCHGNRSAVLYELNRITVSTSLKYSSCPRSKLFFMQDCLTDIGLALSFGFPRESEYKLHRRRALCLAQLGRKEEAINCKQWYSQKYMVDNWDF